MYAKDSFIVDTLPCLPFKDKDFLRICPKADAANPAADLDLVWQ